MRIMIQEQRKQQLKIVESQSALMLKEKDEEIGQAKKKMSELEHFVRKLEVEIWYKKRDYKEKQAMALDLNTILEDRKKRIESHWYETKDENEEMGGEERGIG